jgi:hypothetical protein
MNWLILADATPISNEDWWKQISPSRNEFSLLFVAIGVIAISALVWAVFIRKRERDRPNRYSYPRVSAEKNGPSSDSGSGRQRRRKRKRRRNPTLAETGGLPPLRSEGMPDDPP